MRRLRSITGRLTLGFFVVSLAAVGVLFLYVAPSLETRLRAQELETLRSSAVRWGGELAVTIASDLDRREVDALVAEVAEQANARVTLLNVSRGDLGLSTYPVADSTRAEAAGDLRFEVARRAAETGRITTGTEAGQGGPMAEVARPLRRAGRTRVVVFSAPLNDVAAIGSLIRRRVLVAGALAVLVAVLAGLLIARALARRIGRLERAARQVAAGDFSTRFPVDRDDELGQLAATLDDMQRQLAQVENARKRFIATASHELRTPIFSLGGFLELLQDEDLDDETRAAFLGQVRESVDRLGKLTTELLDLSRLEAGSLELRPEPTDLSALAEAVSDEFVPALGRHASHLELRLPREGMEAVCDPDRVAQVLRILIDNALTHTPEGTDIVVAAARKDGEVQLAVRDFGPGIKRSAVGRIFEPFVTSDDAQGSGLGLAIAHELAEHMDGRLTVESQPGRTTFSFALPA